MSMHMNQTPYAAIALALALSNAWAQPAETKSASAASAASTALAGAKAALTVSVVSPRPGQWTSALPVNGNIAAWGEAIIGSQVGGLRVVELLAQVGDAVSAGQLLARLDDAPVQQDLAQARAALLDAQAQLQEAAANAQRAKGLSDTGALSAQQQGQFEVAEAVARARVATAQAAVAAQELRLHNTRVVAPDAGLVSARSATLGAVPGTGQELFRLIRQGRLEWRAEVPAAELVRVKPGAVARLTTPPVQWCRAPCARSRPRWTRRRAMAWPMWISRPPRAATPARACSPAANCASMRAAR